MNKKSNIQLSVRTRYKPQKMLLKITMSVVMTVWNCMTLSSLTQQDKSTLASYAT